MYLKSLSDMVVGNSRIGLGDQDIGDTIASDCPRDDNEGAFLQMWLEGAAGTSTNDDFCSCL